MAQADWLDVSSITPRIAYTVGATPQTVFVVPFIFFSSADLIVAVNGVVKILGTHYTAAGAGSETGGTIAFLTPQSNCKVSIVRDIAIALDTHIPTFGPLDVGSINLQFARFVAIQQEFDARSIQLPSNEGATGHILSPVATRKNRLLGFSTTGEIIYPIGPSFVSDTAIGVATVDSVATAETTSFTAGIQRIQTGGRGRAWYARVDTEPSHDGKFQSADGAWWEMTEATVNQYMFGAIDDAAIDSTTAIKAMHAYCLATEARFEYDAGAHKITETITVRSSGNMSAATFYADATVVSPVVRLGSAVSADYVFTHEVFTPTIINTAKAGLGWAGFETGIGLEIANCYHWRIFVTAVENFGVGVNCTAYGLTGCVYNDIFLQYLFNSKLNLRLKASTNDAWVNENNFYGGRLSHDSSEGTSVSGVFHIVLIEASDGDISVGGLPNNNVFYKPSIEGVTQEYNIYLQGSYNKFIQCRWESPNPAVAIASRAGARSIGNDFDGGYNFASVRFDRVGTDAPAWNGARSSGHLQIEGGIGGESLVNIVHKFDDASPHIAGYPTTSYSLDKMTAVGSEWLYLLSGKSLSGKRATDEFERVIIDWNNGRIRFGEGGSAPASFIGAAGSSIAVNADFIPAIDNSYQLGGSAARYNFIYATSGTVSTSDAREKEWRGELSPAELRVAKRLSKLIGIYRWLDAIEKKGDGARLHIGVTAQAVQEAFAAEGLDGLKYGVLCYDEWDAVEEKDGIPGRAAGNRYGIRYEQLWGFVAAGFEARLSALE